MMPQKYGKPWGPPQHVKNVELFEFFPNLDSYTGFDGPDEFEKLAIAWFEESDMGEWLRGHQAKYDILWNEHTYYVMIQDSNLAMRFKLTFG